MIEHLHCGEEEKHLHSLLAEPTQLMRNFLISSKEIKTAVEERSCDIEQTKAEHYAEILWAQNYDPPNFRSVLSDGFEHCQVALSGLLARDFPLLSFDVFNEMVCGNDF